MELKAEYRRETYRNYVIFDKQEDHNPDNKREENYEIPMLLNNKIPYLLHVQITYLNERARHAYDITSNQAILDWIERRKIKNKDCEHLYSSIFGAIDACSEYLLDERNLVLLPEYIYYDLGKDNYRFIYHMYYQRDILLQVNELSEYLMDHIDYEDERAVLLVYAMYHESKRKEASIDTLITVFQEKKKSNENKIMEKSQKLDGNQKVSEAQKLDKDQLTDEIRRSEACDMIDEDKWDKENKKNIREVTQTEQLRDYESTKKEKVVELTRKQLIKRPIMESRLESERLVSKYPVLSYSVVLVTLLVMLIVIVYSIIQGLEVKKLIAVILIVASITAYIGSKMFDPKKKVEKMVPIVEYIKQPEMSAHKQPVINTLNQSEDRINMDNNNEFYIKEKTQEVMEDDLSECTQLLSIVADCSDTEDALENDNPSNSTNSKIQYVLLPEDDKYKQLKLKEFPFYIGKITDGMDAVIMESTISRVHAKITQEDENLYITDMGSTNGTFVNEENIQPHSKVPIKFGDILRFANITYSLVLNE
ncbi:MAG: FHA domain-containing protein [Clostridiales bacterium]|nr:FHA domain-containing protein [Clostridiales bacterium]